MNTEFPYSSLHDYLDEVLELIVNPSDLQIKEAKDNYWRFWYKHYRQTKRKQYREFTLRFDKTQLQEINAKKGNLSVSKFLYHAVSNTCGSDTILAINNQQLTLVNQSLMHLINLVEDYAQEGIGLEDISKRLVIIKKQLSELKNKL